MCYHFLVLSEVPGLNCLFSVRGDTHYKHKVNQNLTVGTLELLLPLFPPLQSSLNNFSDHNTIRNSAHSFPRCYWLGMRKAALAPCSLRALRIYTPKQHEPGVGKNYEHAKVTWTFGSTFFAWWAWLKNNLLYLFKYHEYILLLLVF